MNILLISGHGAGDPGATGNGKREADETRKVTAALHKILSKYCSVSTYPSDRNAFEDYKNGTLAAVAQFQKYDYVLEVHFNAISNSPSDGKTKGVEAYVPTTTTDTSLEQSICAAVSKCGLTNRGVKLKNWSVIARAKQSGVPSSLLEVCFIDDPDDMSVYLNKFNAIVDSIASSIVNHFHLNEEEPDVTYETFKEYMDQYLMELAAKNPSDWSKDARIWAEENGIIQGDANGNKKYKSNITREEAVAILFRALHK